MEIHFVYAGYYYCYYGSNGDRLRSFILKGMKKYKIKKVLVTIISMWRGKLIRKETMENCCNGKDILHKESVNDDLEKLNEDIKLGKKPDYLVRAYFLPKLTKEELDLVERKDHDFMKTLNLEMYADVPKAEMMLSESDSKFVYGWSHRKTFTIKNSKKRIQKSIEK